MRVSTLSALVVPLVTAPLLLTSVGTATAHAAAASTVAITSPANGTYADGTISVTADGTTDAASGVDTSSMVLYVDYQPKAQLDCPTPSSGSCTQSFSLDADALTAGDHVLQVMLQTNTAGADVVSSSVAIGAHSPAPSVSLSLRESGPLYEQQFGASVSADVYSEGWSRTPGLPMTQQLLVDGTPVGSPLSCPPTVVGQNPCFHVAQTRLQRGVHTVQARLTVGSATVDSAARTVTVLAPTVAITSPAPGTVVRGTVSVTVVGTVAGPDDKAVSLGLAHNGAPVPQQTATCDPSAAICTATFEEDASSLYSLVGTFTTSHLTVNSSKVVVTAYVNEQLWVYGATVRSGHLTTVRGGLGGSLSPVPAGTLVTVRLAPAHGKATTVHVPLGSNGSFSLLYRPTTNTTVTASLAAGAAYSSASATSVLLVTPAPRCRLAAQVARGALTPLTCSLAYLPKGTRVTLQFSAHKHWHTAVTRTSAAGAATLPFHWSRQQTLWVRVVIAANHDFARFVGKPFTVKVT